MNTDSYTTFSYAMLLEPEVVQAAAERAAKWNLPRRTCRPLDRGTPRRISAEVAAYDATIEQAAQAEESAAEANPAQ